jgi:hypothetical protein
MNRRAKADRMRFYFDLKLDAEEPSEDEEGLELEDAEAAQFEAARLLFDLSRETIRFKKQLQVRAVIVRKPAWTVIQS